MYAGPVHQTSIRKQIKALVLHSSEPESSARVLRNHAAPVLFAQKPSETRTSSPAAPPSVASTASASPANSELLLPSMVAISRHGR